VIYATKHKTNILPGDRPALLSELTPRSVAVSQARVTVRINPIKQVIYGVRKSLLLCLL